MTDQYEPTPWEDINPPMGLAARREPQLPSSERLQPASSDTFRDELTACLALVAPAGMTEENRRDWLLVAWQSLSHLPADILKIGCKAARQTCDHPSKIVPTIIAETKEMMGWRKDSARTAAHEPLQLSGPPPEYCTPEQASEILVRYGLKRAPYNDRKSA